MDLERRAAPNGSASPFEFLYGKINPFPEQDREGAFDPGLVDHSSQILINGAGATEESKIRTGRIIINAPFQEIEESPDPVFPPPAQEVPRLTGADGSAQETRQAAKESRAQQEFVNIHSVPMYRARAIAAFQPR